MTAVAADISSEAGRDALLAACRAPDVLPTYAGWPPPVVWSDSMTEHFLKVIDGNLPTPTPLLEAVLPGMISRRCG